MGRGLMGGLMELWRRKISEEASGDRKQMSKWRGGAVSQRDGAGKRRWVDRKRQAGRRKVGKKMD